MNKLEKLCSIGKAGAILRAMRISILQAEKAQPVRIAAGIVLLMIAAMLLLSTRAGGTTIFDDDWKPPTPPAKPAMELPTTPPPSTPATGTTPSQTPVPTAAPTTEAARLKIPVPADLNKSRALFKDVFAKELADHSTAGLRAFAHRLLDEAQKSASVPSDQYILLIGAANCGREGSDLALSFQALDGLAGAFDVDAVQYKADFALRTSLKSDTPAMTVQNCKAALAFVDDLAAQNDYASAVRLLGELRSAATIDPALSKHVQARSTEVEASKVAWDRLAVDATKLKTSPDDGPANLAVGKYLCLTKGNWTKGLPLLAKGTDQKLKKLAQDELDEKATPEAIAQSGDGWWDLAGTLPEPTKAIVLQHAAAIYSKVRDQVTGLRRELLDKRIQQASASPIAPAVGTQVGHRVVNLIALIDPDEDAVKGAWKIVGGKLFCESSTDSRLRIPYLPADEYDFHIQFIRQAGKDGVCQILTHGGRDFLWVNGEDQNTIHGFSRVGGKDCGHNPTKAAVLPEEKANGRMHDSVVQVRQAYIAAYVDGRLVSRHDTNFSDMSISRDWSIGGGALGLATLHTPTAFSIVEVTEITGTGQVLPHRK
jgi:hypothetical protein